MNVEYWYFSLGNFPALRDQSAVEGRWVLCRYYTTLASLKW